MFSRIYLDNAATTPIDAEVLAAMMPFLTEQFGNASSIHYYGQQARRAVDKARHQVASIINARPNEIVFTSGGTESNNLAVRGLIEANEKYGRHIITSAIEHSAVKNVCEDLEKRGYEVTYLPVYENGIVRLEDVKEALRADTVLITVMTANNEIGTVQPIVEIGSLVKNLRTQGQKIWFHTDAVQALGKMKVDVEEFNCDLLSVSAHKIYAPKGIGALYIRRGVRLHAQNIGGHQERDRRGGTESVPHIVAFGEACRLAEENLNQNIKSLKEMRDHLENNILEIIPGSFLNGDRDKRIPSITNISFTGIEGEALLINLDLQGIAVSTGSACSSGSLEPSPVIRALGKNDELARGAIRFSFGKGNSEEQIIHLGDLLLLSIQNIRSLGNTL